MTPSVVPGVVPGFGTIDWSRPWLAPWRARGEALAARANERGLLVALNDSASGVADLRLHAGRVRFIGHGERPTGEAYEAFIARTACIPTRENLHDFFNALVWLEQPALKRRLNELQATQLTAARPGASRGAVRDALTLFDENAALLHAPAALLDALRRRDWQALFISQRGAWGQARLLVFGHALMGKLVRPRKAITAHVWCAERLGVDATDRDVFGERLLASLTAEHLATKPFLPLPVLGVPGWWPANESPGFYADPEVFRPPR